jgi:hypothetical protein
MQVQMKPREQISKLNKTVFIILLPEILVCLTKTSSAMT